MFFPVAPACSARDASNLVILHAKRGRLQDAQIAFDAAQRPNVVAWTCLISAYTAKGEGGSALQLFSRMHNDGCSPNSFTFVAALQACVTLASAEAVFSRGRDVHRMAAERGLDSDPFVCNALVSMYMRCGRPREARRIFYRMRQPNEVAFTAMVMGYAANEEAQAGLEIFFRASREGIARSDLMLLGALKACAALAKLGDVSMALRVGNAVRSGADSAGMSDNPYLGSALVNMYARCGRMEEAQQAFDGMQRKNRVLWTCLILGYADNAEGSRALEAFYGMLADGCEADARAYVAALKACSVLGKQEPAAALREGASIRARTGDACFTNTFIGNSLLELYASCGEMAMAADFFERMRERDAVSWNTMVLGHAENGESGIAMRALARMRLEGIRPDAITFIAALKACCARGDAIGGIRIHDEARAMGLESSSKQLQGALIDFYGKCWSTVESQRVFDRLPARGRDLVAWTSLIASYSRHGDARNVFELFERMLDARVWPNEVTFICILAVCSHAGLVRMGLAYFEDMASKYGVQPNIHHYTCVIDMLARANEIDAAMQLIHRLPLEANAVAWRSLLGACRERGNLDAGKLAAASLLSVADADAEAYASLATMYLASRDVHK